MREPSAPRGGHRGGEQPQSAGVRCDATVVVPWRGGDPHREAAYAWVRDRYERDGWRVVEGNAPQGPWRKASALANGVTQVTTNVVIFADADVWTDGIPEALEHVADTGWAIPHRRVRRLTPTATTAVLDGGPLDGELEQHHYVGWEGGGIVAVTRDTWNEVPMDPRFAGWGLEDESWALALRTLIGAPWRGLEPLWHLWHPPQARQSRRVGSSESLALRERYGQAAKDRDLMETLIGEVRDELAVPARP